MATKRNKPQRMLSMEQLNAIDLLVTGKTDQDTADAIGVHRVTVTKWRNYDVVFRAELNARRKDLSSVTVDKMRALLPRALDTLAQELEGKNGWRVAVELIKMAGIDKEVLHKDTRATTPEHVIREAASEKLGFEWGHGTTFDGEKDMEKYLQTKLEEGGSE